MLKRINAHNQIRAQACPPTEKGRLYHFSLPWSTFRVALAPLRPSNLYDLCRKSISFQQICEHLPDPPRTTNSFRSSVPHLLERTGGLGPLGRLRRFRRSFGLAGHPGQPATEATGGLTEQPSRAPERQPTSQPTKTPTSTPGSHPTNSWKPVFQPGATPKRVPGTSNHQVFSYLRFGIYPVTKKTLFFTLGRASYSRKSRVPLAIFGQTGDGTRMSPHPISVLRARLLAAALGLSVLATPRRLVRLFSPRPPVFVRTKSTSGAKTCKKLSWFFRLIFIILHIHSVLLLDFSYRNPQL